MLIPGTLGTSQHDFGLPSEDTINCFLLGSMSPNPIPNNCPSVTLLCEPGLCKEASPPMFIALWCKAESEFVRRQLVSGGGERYAPLLYGDVSIRFSFGLDRIGPTPTLLTTLSRYTIGLSLRPAFISSKLLKALFKSTELLPMWFTLGSDPPR